MKPWLGVFLLAGGLTASAPATVIQTGTGGTTDPGLSASGATISAQIQMAADQAAFDAAGLWDAGTSTVGGGSIAGDLYYAFWGTSLDRDGQWPNEIPTGLGPGNSFAGGQLYSGNTERVLVGNNWGAWAYSYAQAGTGNLYFGSGYLDVMRNTPVLFVGHVQYGAGGSDTINLKVSYSGTDYVATITGQDAAFDNFRFRSGHNNATYNNRWTFSGVGFATSEAEAIAAIPEPGSLGLLVLAAGAAALFRRRHG